MNVLEQFDRVMVALVLEISRRALAQFDAKIAIDAAATVRLLPYVPDVAADACFKQVKYQTSVLVVDALCAAGWCARFAALLQTPGQEQLKMTCVRNCFDAINRVMVRTGTDVSSVKDFVEWLVPGVMRWPS